MTHEQKPESAEFRTREAQVADLSSLFFKFRDPWRVARSQILEAEARGAAEREERGFEEAKDEGANYVLTSLALLFGRDGFEIRDGSETWEGDVHATLEGILKAGGLIDDDGDLLDLATLKDRLTAQRRKDAEEAEKRNHDDECIAAFALLMREKMKFSREVKGRGGWQDMPAEILSEMLRNHVEKGDPVDVANFCMMLSAIGASIAEAQGAAEQRRKDAEGVMPVGRVTGHWADGTPMFDGWDTAKPLALGAFVYDRPANVAVLEKALNDIGNEVLEGAEPFLDAVIRILKTVGIDPLNGSEPMDQVADLEDRVKELEAQLGAMKNGTIRQVIHSPLRHFKPEERS